MYLYHSINCLRSSAVMFLSSLILFLLCFNHAISSPRLYESVLVPVEDIRNENPYRNTIKNILETWKRDLDRKLENMEKNILDTIEKKLTEITIGARCQSETNILDEATETDNVVSNVTAELHKISAKTLFENNSGTNVSNEEVLHEGNDDQNESDQVTTQASSDSSSAANRFQERKEVNPPYEDTSDTNTKVYFKNIGFNESVSEGCKEFLCTKHERGTYKFYDIYDLDNTIVMRNSSGNIFYFETHFVMPRKTIYDIARFSVRLTPTKEVQSDTNIYEMIWYYFIHQVDLYVNCSYESAKLSENTDEFMSFYIKISEEELQFGREGDNSPLITFNNGGSILPFKYLGFDTDASSESPFFYDCPK